MYNNRSYVVHGTFAGGMNLSLRIDDQIGPMVADLVKKSPGIAKRALRHVAYVTSMDMKNMLNRGKGTLKQSVLKGSRELAFRSERRRDGKKKIGKAPHLPHRLKKRTTHRQMLKKHVRRRNRWMGSSLAKNRYMARAIGYDTKTFKDAVTIGWLSKSAVKWAKKYQSDSTQKVNDDMRGYFAAIGIPLKETTKVIRTKGDDFMPRYYKQNRSQMARIFRDRFLLKYNERIQRQRA